MLADYNKRKWWWWVSHSGES